MSEMFFQGTILVTYSSIGIWQFYIKDICGFENIWKFLKFHPLFATKFQALTKFKDQRKASDTLLKH